MSSMPRNGGAPCTEYLCAGQPAMLRLCAVGEIDPIKSGIPKTRMRSTDMLRLCEA